MKATKKIVGAACALVAAVALSAGSTFAWFVSNAEVTATGLEVGVVTTNSYLIISDQVSTLGENKTTISLAPKAAADGGEAKAEQLNPSAHLEVVETEAEGKITVNDLDTMGNWYTGKGTTPTNGALDESTKQTLTSFSSYVVVDDIFVSVAAGSENVKDVKMTMVEKTGWDSSLGNSAISVVLLWRKVTIPESGSTTNPPDYTYAHYLEANKANNHAVSNVSLGEVSSTEYIQIHVMVYFDGNNEQVTGQNAKSLNGVTLDFTFDDGTPVSGGGSSEENA